MNPMIGAALVSGGIGALGNIFGASSQNRMNMSMMRMQNSYNQQMMDKKNRFSEYMYDRNNLYNSPLEARKRLEKAGLNPYLASGQVAAGQSSSSSPTSAEVAPSAGAALKAPLKAASESLSNTSNDLVNGYTNIMMAESQSAKNLSDSAKTDADAKVVQEWGMRQAGLSADLTRSQIQLNDATKQKTELQNQITETYGFQKEAQNLAIQGLTSELMRAKTDNIEMLSKQIRSNIALIVQKMKGQKIDNIKQAAAAESFVQLLKQEVQLKYQQARQAQLNFQLDKKFEAPRRRLGNQNLVLDKTVKGVNIVSSQNDITMKRLGVLLQAVGLATGTINSTGALKSYRHKSTNQTTTKTKNSDGSYDTETTTHQLY